jgi:hypothetical protein
VPVPVGSVDPQLGQYLQELEDRLAAVENPQGPKGQFPIASANLSTSSAVTYKYCTVYVTDLNILAHSDGSHWYREDTGGVIV